MYQICFSQDWYSMQCISIFENMIFFWNILLVITQGLTGKQITLECEYVILINTSAMSHFQGHKLYITSIVLHHWLCTITVKTYPKGIPKVKFKGKMHWSHWIVFQISDKINITFPSKSCTKTIISARRPWKSTPERTAISIPEVSVWIEGST